MPNEKFCIKAHCIQKLSCNLTVESTLQVPLPLHCGPPGDATGQGMPSSVSPSAAAAAALLLLLPMLPMLRVSMRLLLLLLVGFATRHEARMA
jgi:membrane-associated phospholipid phosphatase